MIGVFYIGQSALESKSKWRNLKSNLFMNKTKGEDLKISNLRCYYNYAINFCCEKNLFTVTQKS